MLRSRSGVGAVRVPLDHAAPDGPGFDVSYAEAGIDQAGPTMVLVPGGPELASALPYRKVRARLAAHGMHVVTPAHRGIGLSRHTPDRVLLPGGAVTLEQAPCDVLAVCDAVGGQRTILAGSSYGGYLALEAAHRAPGRFEALPGQHRGDRLSPRAGPPAGVLLGRHRARLRTTGRACPRARHEGDRHAVDGLLARAEGGQPNADRSDQTSPASQADPLPGG
jgi:pimeloyl-ACP methyl ester carboxylesterase